jgi:hypothetical protein
MIRLLLEDVTLNRDEQISLQIRFKGGACRTLHLPLPLCAWQQRVTPPRVIDEIDHLLDDHTVAQIADILNARGMTPGAGASFHPQLVARLARTYHLKPRYDRLRERGMLTQQEMADTLQVTPHTVKIWLRRGLLRGHAYSDKNESLCTSHRATTPRARHLAPSSRCGALMRGFSLIVRRRCSMRHSPCRSCRRCCPPRARCRLRPVSRCSGWTRTASPYRCDAPVHGRLWVDERHSTVRTRWPEAVFELTQ